jgi:hypothetical protein
MYNEVRRASTPSREAFSLVNAFYGTCLIWDLFANILNGRTYTIHRREGFFYVHNPGTILAATTTKEGPRDY